MGPLEQMVEELKEINHKLDELPAAAGSGSPQLIEGKAVLNTREASNYTNIGEGNLRDLARSNQIPHIMNGNHFLFPISALNDWLRETSQKNYDDIKDPTVLNLVKEG